MFLRSGRRSRSRSPPLKIPGLRRAKRRRHDDSVKEIRLYYRAVGDGATKSFLLNISAHDIGLFSKLNYSNNFSHNHSDEQQEDCNSITFSTRPLDSEYLACVSEDPMGNAAVIGSTVYASYYGRMLTLDLCDPDGGFGPIPTPPSCPDPYCSIIYDQRQTPKLIALGGGLFFFGGNLSSTPFADVYDPLTNSWSPLLAPKGLDVAKCLVLFRASLGESRGEILFYGSHDKTDEMSPTWFYTYHVDSGNWRTLPSTVDFGFPEPMDWFIVGQKAVIKEQDDSCTSMYWLDRYCKLHAFNWETLKVSHGQVVGFKHEDLPLLVDETFDDFSLFHVIGHLFCLAWTQYIDTKHTAFHITFLKVIEDDPAPGSLTAYVVGCIKYAADGGLECFDAFPV